MRGLPRWLKYYFAREDEGGRGGGAEVGKKRAQLGPMGGGGQGWRARWDPTGLKGVGCVWWWLGGSCWVPAWVLLNNEAREGKRLRRSLGSGRVQPGGITPGRARQVRCKACPTLAGLAERQ